MTTTINDINYKMNYIKLHFCRLISNLYIFILFYREVERKLNVSHYTNVDIYTTLCNVNFEEFQDFVKSFTDHLFIHCLVQGNMTQDAVIETVRQCIELINCDPLPSSTSPQTKVTRIPLGTYYCKLKNINNIDINSVVTNYYQAGDTSIELSVLIELLIVSIK